MFKKNHPLLGMMYSLGEISKLLEDIARELKRSNDLKYDIYVWNKKDRQKGDL